LAILSVLQTGELHGYEIARRIEQQTGGKLKFTLASLYPLLYRMEKRGWVRGEWQPARADGGAAVIASPRVARRRLCRCGRNGLNYLKRCDSLRRCPMPDWEKLVSDRLAQLALEERERQEVIAELAGHLEEIYEGSRGKGASHDEAIRRALQQVDDWKKLGRKSMLHGQRRIHECTHKPSMGPQLRDARCVGNYSGSLWTFGTATGSPRFAAAP